MPRYSLKPPTAIETDRRMNSAADAARQVETSLLVQRRAAAGVFGPESVFSAVRKAVNNNPNSACDSNHAATVASRSLGYQQSSSGIAMISPPATRRPTFLA